MASRRYTVEFRAEAVRQSTERGYPVREIAGRLGVSSHLLYKWLKDAGKTPRLVVQEDLPGLGGKCPDTRLASRRWSLRSQNTGSSHQERNTSDGSCLFNRHDRPELEPANLTDKSCP